MLIEGYGYGFDKHWAVDKPVLLTRVKLLFPILCFLTFLPCLPAGRLDEEK